jgi:glycosyltransferase involved in cell wall biosynthesis
MDPRFSVCIPNFNYLRYLRLTYESVAAQSFTNFEVLISDNCSTDGSAEFIRELGSLPFVRTNFNESNLGFSANLERVSSLASGDFFILLSSDDLMNEGCLESYNRILKMEEPSKTIIGSSVHKIDSDGKVIEYGGPDPQFWRPEDVDAAMTKEFGNTVYRVRGPEMLRRSLNAMGNPYYFLTVCYPRELFRTVGGYSGGRMFGPDKWFNWKLFSEADSVLLIDRPLFSYRWHAQNQVAQESSHGHLKYLVDDYRNTIELSDRMLHVAGISRTMSERNFVIRDIYRHGIGEFTKGRWIKSLRVFFLGLALFPKIMVVRPLFIPYALLLCSTPLGAMAVHYLFRNRQRK